MAPLRTLVVLAALGLASTAQADEPPEEVEEVEDDRNLQVEDGLPKPDPEDLRTGHWLISAGGGVWVPTAPFSPDIPGLGNFNSAGTVSLQLGVGLSRSFVLGLDGGYGRFFGACEGCNGDSFQVGLSATAHLTQAFAFDPIASFGVGYRRTSISAELPVETPAFDSFDFARLLIGGIYYPVSSFGLGPVMGLDVGVSDFDDPEVFAAFTTSLRVTFDPMRMGTTVAPQVAQR